MAGEISLVVSGDEPPERVLPLSLLLALDDNEKAEAKVVMVAAMSGDGHGNDAAAAVVGGVEEIFMKPGSKVLYLGAASGTTVSHVADLVGPEGAVYAVEFSKRSGRDLVNMAKKRTNVIPIIEDARHP